MSSVTIRDADPGRDSAACAAIYAPSVEDGVTSFEERPPDPVEMAARIAAVGESHVWLVAEAGGEAVGYAYGCAHRERAAYRWAVDVSVYVAAAWHGRGVGTRLYESLFTRLSHLGYQVACAGITLPNSASVALHERLGFEAVGVNRRIGWKQGAWHDVGWWQLELVPAGADPPPEPRRPGPPSPPG